MTRSELLHYSREMIAKGSKSFARAAQLFDKETRDSVTLFYAWCRHCDDVIDGQSHGFNIEILTPETQQKNLQHLNEQTEKIFAVELASEPAFQALHQVMVEHDIPQHVIKDVLQGFKIDTDGTPIVTVDDLMQYCYYVAGAVGIVMAAIMGAKDKAVLRRACDLGLAFQLTNIARDVLDDASVGRCYLPQEWLKEKSIGNVAEISERRPVFDLTTRLLGMAEPYYDSAKLGLASLPFRSAWAVASALLIYQAIGHKLLAQGPQAWQGRLQTTPSKKILKVIQGLFLALRMKYCLGNISPRQALWTCRALSD